MKSPHYDFIKNMYLMNRLTKKQVQALVPAKITQEEADSLTD